jgi:hypothetical protein
LPTKYLFHTPQVSFPFCKILLHGADGFASLSKEVVLRNFIALCDGDVDGKRLRFAAARGPIIHPPGD